MIQVLEEADNRIVCHVNDAIRNGFSNILVQTGDTDVILILMGFMEQFLETTGDVDITVEFKSSSGRKILSMNSIYIKHGQKICSALPFFHSFTGADSTTSFFKISKKDCFSYCMDLSLHESLTETFMKLSHCPSYDV